MMHMSRCLRYARLLVAAALTLTATGCTTFQRDWRRAVAAPADHTGLEGPWDGHWRSELSGHNGRLRCLVTRLDHNTYKARFHATYRKIFRFTSAVTLTAEQTGEVYRFEGETELARWAGGHYRYEGHATATNFFSTYTSRRDFGVFQMHRPVHPPDALRAPAPPTP
jgi:hypothetical protein